MSDVVIQPQDQKYFRNDPSFDPRRNKQIILDSLKENDEYSKKMLDLRKQDRDLRVDVIASFGKHRLSDGKSTSFKEYIGRDLYNRLIGEKIASKVKNISISDKLRGYK